jgi:hypothetical protein
MRKTIVLPYWWYDGIIEQNYARKIYEKQMKDRLISIPLGFQDMIIWNQGRPWN